MAIELVCPCGQVVRCDQPPAGGQARCPACGALLSAAAERQPRATSEQSPASGARKPLWALMGKASPASAVSQVAQPGDRPAELPPAIPPAALTPATGKGGSGEAPPASVAPSAIQPAAPAPVRKGLWRVMQNSAAVPAPAPAPPNTELSARQPPPGEPNPGSEIPLPDDSASAVLPADTARDAVPSDAALAAVIGIPPEETGFLSQKRSAAVRTGQSRKGLLAASLGGLSILLSFLALIDMFWSKIPATLVGFAGILLGMQAASEIQYSAGRQTGRRLAVAGIISGVVGVFLGPLLLAGVGRRMWQESTRSLTEGHLQTIGHGLNRYCDREGVFPPGGIFKPGKDKRQRGVHGWMTHLLPFVGEERLYRRIQLDLPFDDPANLSAFEENVDIFFASGTDRSKVHGGLGVSHFAGVGGDVEKEGGDAARAGLFGVNSAVRREDVTDGLSSTLAVGEIADELPPWGDTENWRSVGKGLNRERQGFGNHDRNGACFLMADGSVRFFSNNTSQRVLTALSTRDGGEKTEK